MCVSRMCGIASRGAKPSDGIQRVCETPGQTERPRTERPLEDAIQILRGTGRSRRSASPVDGGFTTTETNTALEGLANEIYIAGRQETGSKRTRRRRKRYRTGAEGRISHLKRGYGLNRSRLKATKATKSGTAGRPSPTTSTPTPPSDDTREPG